MADTATLQKMQADLQAFRSGKGSGTSADPQSPIAADLAAYRQQKAAGTLPAPQKSSGLFDTVGKTIQEGYKDTIGGMVKNPGGLSPIAPFPGGQPLLRAAGTAGGVVGDVVTRVAKAGIDKIPENIRQGAKDFVAPAVAAAAPIIEAGKKVVEGVSKVAPETVKDVKAASNAVNLEGLNIAKIPLKVLAKASDKAVLEHYIGVNEKDFLRPTTVNEPLYAKATAVYNDAKARGIDLEKAATQQGIIHDKIASKGVYNTTDAADTLREGNYKVSDEIARPAIKAAESGVPLIPVDTVRTKMLDRIHSLPKSQIDDTDRALFAKQIAKRYEPGSASDLAHPNGYSLTELHDARIVAQKNGGYKVGQSASDALKAQRNREEGRVFADIFDTTVPPEVGMKDFRKELEKNFLLADYLEQLHGKHVPQGITAKAIRLFGRGLGGVLGSKVGGFPGFLVGSRGGDMLFNAFETRPNPIKTSALEAVKVQEPKVFQQLKAYIGTKELEKLTMKRLPGKGESSFKEVPPTLHATPGGVITPNAGEAADIAAVETGKAKPTTTNRKLKSYLEKVKNAQEADQQYLPQKVIEMGPGKRKTPKKLGDIY